MKNLSHLAGRALATLVVVGCLSCPTFADDTSGTRSVPELDPGSMASALALLSGGALLMSSRRKTTS